MSKLNNSDDKCKLTKRVCSHTHYCIDTKGCFSVDVTEFA